METPGEPPSVVPQGCRSHHRRTNLVPGYVKPDLRVPPAMAYHPVRQEAHQLDDNVALALLAVRRRPTRRLSVSRSNSPTTSPANPRSRCRTATVVRRGASRRRLVPLGHPNDAWASQEVVIVPSMVGKSPRIVCAKAHGGQPRVIVGGGAGVRKGRQTDRLALPRDLGCPQRGSAKGQRVHRPRQSANDRSASPGERSPTATCSYSNRTYGATRSIAPT